MVRSLTSSRFEFSKTEQPKYKNRFDVVVDVYYEFQSVEGYWILIVMNLNPFFLGYAMECSVFMKGTGIRFAEAGYAVFGIDYEGHGKSEGKRCYVQSFQDIVDDNIAYFKSVRGTEGLKLSPQTMWTCNTYPISWQKVP